MVVGCAKPAQGNNGPDKENLTITTSFYPIYLHVINIAKDIPGIEVVNMTQPQTGCLHDYQISPDDMKTLNRADIFVINGGGMESFMDKVLSQLPQMAIIDASEHIELLEEEHHDDEHDDGENNEEEHHHEFNPHVWVGVSGAIEQVSQIAKELAILDPEHKEQYEKNADIYIGKLETLRDEMHASLDDIPNKNIVTFHEAFPYFAKEFGLNIVGTIVTEAGSEPSAKELAAVIESIIEFNVQAVFAEPQFTSKSASLISKEANVALYTLDPVVTGQTDQDQKENYDDYINTMKENLKTLEEALR